MKSYQWGAVAVLLAAGAWIASGQFGVADTPAQTSTSAKPATKLQRVSVNQPASELYTRRLILPAQTRALREIDIRAEISGRIEKLPIEQGQSVKQGDLIAQFGLDTRPAELEQAKALLDERSKNYNSAKKLAQKQLATQIKLSEYLADLEAAKTDVLKAQDAINHASVKAPFAGILDRRYVEIGQFMQIDEQIATLVDLDPLVITAQVAERDVDKLKIGQEGSATLITGQTLKGKLSYISRIAEDSTRTFTVELQAPNPDGRFAAGLSAELILPVAQEKAIQISRAAISLAEDGTIGLKTIDNDNVVQFQPITIIGEGPKGFWVSGLAEGSQIIVVGQDFVQDGQTVDPVEIKKTATP